MDLRRLAPLALLVPAVAVAGTLKPRWPEDQAIRYDLGSAAARLDELDARWAPAGGKGIPTDSADGEWTREAVFRYAAGGAPRVVASGRGAIGERIIETARASGVPLESNPALAAALAEVEIGEEIPLGLYKAVAEVLLFILRVSGRVR